MFSKSLCCKLKENYDKSVAVQFAAVFSRTRLLSKSFIKQELMDIEVIPFLGVKTFRSTKAMKLVFLFKMKKILSRFEKCNKN